VPHFTVMPMVLERTDLILTLPARVARVYEAAAASSLPPPVPIPPADVACTGTSASTAIREPLASPAGRRKLLSG
jgi:hypothetical protein